MNLVYLCTVSSKQIDGKWFVKISVSTYIKGLTLLKSAYFEVLASCNDFYSEVALSKLCFSEDAYMSFIECSGVDIFG
jgi:hypothetical protein